MAGTRGKRTRDEEPVTAAAPAGKASKAAGKAPAKPAKEEKAKPAGKAAKKGAAATAKADPNLFTETLMDVCKVLMGVCETVMDEDEENFSIVSGKDFKAHGAPLLMLLPQEARLPMMNIACMYMEELDADPYMWGDDSDSDDEDEDDEEIDEGDEEMQEDEQAHMASLAAEAIKWTEEADGSDDEDDDDEEDDEEDDDLWSDLPDTMKAAHFFPFKQFFTQAEAAALVKSAEEGGELYDAMDAAYASWRKAMEEEDDAIGEEGEG